MFAVNAGSNTLSMFEADARDASKLKLISQSAELPGEFPTTVDASDNHKLACVGFTGAKSGVSCLSYSKKGLGRADALRDFNLGQTTPPNSSLALVGSTFFSGDQNYVYTTVRGDKNFAFYSFPVYGYGKASSQGVKSLPNFPRNLFGAESVPGTNKVVSSDTIIGADVLTVGRSQVPAITEVNVAGQKASCWITQSVKTGSGYVTDSKIDRLVEFDLNTGAIIKELNLNTGDAGHNDAAVGGNYLYTLYSGNVTAGIEASVTVVDTNGEKGYMKRVEHYLLDGVTTNSVGLALKM